MVAAIERAEPGARPDGQIVLEIERLFEAPRALVFEMWIKGKNMQHWAAPDGFALPVNEGDARLGGEWRSCMRSPEGEEMWLSGVYREITPPERLVFTHQWDGGIETLVSVSFEELPGRRTKMRFRQTGFESAASRDGHDGGWQQSFDKLRRYLTHYLADDARLAPAGDVAPHVLEIERVFNAPRELVFKLWSVPEHIVRWWGPKGYQLGHCEMDFRVGGSWRFAMQPSPDHQHWIHGVYKEIRPPERLSFTYTNDADGHDMLVELDFLAEGEKTRLKFRQAEFMSVLERNAHNGGWSETFDIFDTYLALYQASGLGQSRLGWRQGEVAGVPADLTGGAGA